MEDINIDKRRQWLLQEELKYSTKMIINMSTIYAHFNSIHNHIENNITRYVVNNIRYDAKQMKDTTASTTNVVYNFELMDGGDIVYFNLLLELHKNLLDDSNVNLSRKLSDFKSRIILTDINFIVVYYDINLFIDIYLLPLIESIETRSKLPIESIITDNELLMGQSIKFRSLILSFQRDIINTVNTLKRSIDVFTSVYNELTDDSSKNGGGKVKNMYFNLNLITIKIGEFIVKYKDLITNFINDNIKTEYIKHKQRIEQQQLNRKQYENITNVKEQQQKQKTIKELTTERKGLKELDVNLFKYNKK